jgi:two-component system, OmpR family, response regulator BaeR
MTAHILIVEDEPKIAHVLRDYLNASDFIATCMERGDGVVDYVKKESPALILLDIMLPGLSGTDVCREIRKFSSVPIIVITAKVEEIDRIVHLELGADDYVCKPFSPREVVARVKAVLRRSTLQIASKQLLELGDIRLDEDAHQVSIGGVDLDLTPSEYKLLDVMIRQPGKVFSRAELINRVQGYAFEGYDRTIDSHIKNLRKKVSGLLPGREIIRSVYGVGYQVAGIP